MQTRNYSMTAHTELKDILINHVRETGNYNRWMLDQFCDVLEVPVKEYCEHSVGGSYNRFLDPAAGLEYLCYDKVAKPLPYELITKHIAREITSKYLGDVQALAVYLDDDQIVRIYSYAAGGFTEWRFMQSVHYNHVRIHTHYPYYDGLAKRTAVSDTLCDGAITLYKIPVDQHFSLVAESYRAEIAYAVDEQLALREAVAKLESDGKTLDEYSEPELLAAVTANIVARSEAELWKVAITEESVGNHLLIVGRGTDKETWVNFRAPSYLAACKVLLANTKSREELLENAMLGKARSLAKGLLKNDGGELTLVATNF